MKINQINLSLPFLQFRYHIININLYSLNSLITKTKSPSRFCKETGISFIKIFINGLGLDGTVLSKLPQDRPIVLHCKSGVRSAECLAVVKAAGFADATHVSGGVVAWVKQIDPSLPEY